jgi:hypothetical protein
MKKINPFAVIQTDTGYLTGQDWNDMVDRIEAIEGLVVIERGLAARAEAKAAVAARAHVCGLQGYDGMRDPPCPGCENMQRAF